MDNSETKNTIDIKHPGALHEELHVKQGETISHDKLVEAMKHAKATDNVVEEKRIQFAENAKHFKHGG